MISVQKRPKGHGFAAFGGGMRRARCKRNVFDFVLECLRKVQHHPNCGGKLRAGDTRPYRASPGFGRGGSYPPETLHTDRRRAQWSRPTAKRQAVSLADVRQQGDDTGMKS